MKIRTRNADGSFGDFKKINTKDKSKDEIIDELKKSVEQLNLQVIDLFEQLVEKGVL